MSQTKLRTDQVAGAVFDDQLRYSGDARNDEFTGGPTIDGKWTLVGNTPDVVDVNSTVTGNLFLRRNDTASLVTCYYQPLLTLPLDVILKVSSDTASANYARSGGLMLLPASPTTGSIAFYLGTNWNSSRIIAGLLYSSLSTFGSQPISYGPAGSGIAWVRLCVCASVGRRCGLLRFYYRQGVGLSSNSYPTNHGG